MLGALTSAVAADGVGGLGGRLVGTGAEEDVDAAVEPVTPVDSDVTVAPGFDSPSSLFEVAVRNAGGGEETDLTFEWFLDGERRFPEGPWHGSYYPLGMDFYRPVFPSEGTFTVDVDVYGEAGDARLGSVSWTVHVEEGATEPPGVDRVSPAEETVEVHRGESVDLTLSATANGGTLHRLVWWRGMCDDIIKITDLDCDEATDTVPDYDELGCPVLVWVVDDRGAMTLEHWNFVVD